MTPEGKILYVEILKEQNRQDLKWGEQNHDPFLYLTVLGEEYGEACQAALQSRYGGKTLADYRKELIEVAAVAISAIECLDRTKWEWGNHAVAEKEKV